MTSKKFRLPLKEVNTLYQPVFPKNCLVFKSIVNSILSIILKRLLKKPVQGYYESGITKCDKNGITKSVSLVNYKVWQQWITSALGIPKCGGITKYMFWLELYVYFKKKLLNAFFKALFSYCPLACMCHSRSMNNKINRLDERWLWIIYNDKTSSFADLLAKDGSVTIHTRNLQVLATEM